MHARLIETLTAAGTSPINKEPNPKRFKSVKNDEKIMLENNNNNKLPSIKSSPTLTQVVSSKITNTFYKKKVDLIESLNIIEPEKKLNKKMSPNKSLPNNKIQNSKLNNNRNQNSFACLRNLGSTCYINCIIQVMRYTPGFVLSINRLNKQIDFLKSLKNPDIDFELSRNNDIVFVKNLHELLTEMSKIEQSDRRPIYTPRKFVNTVWTLLTFWSDGSQQDAHEFLQYTIHFINECDLNIRKLQQQHQSKQSEIDNKSENILNHNTNSNNNKLKARKLSSRKSDLDLKELISSTNNANFNILSDESSSSSTSSTCSSSASSTSAISNSTYQSCLLSQKNQNEIRLIKTIPKLNSNCLESNYLRTPTKGGASSFNLSMLESLNSNKNIQLTQSQHQQQTNKSHQSEELIFRPMIKSDSGDITKREPIKVKLQLIGKSNENYKIVNNSLKKSPNLILNDNNDLVSKRLKETLNNSFENNYKIKNNNESLLNKNKRLKHDTDFFLQSDLDSSHIIMMDSDEDNDNDVYFMDDDEPLNNGLSSLKKEETKKNEPLKIEQSNESNSDFKNCFVLLEKIDMEKYLPLSKLPEPELVQSEKQNNLKKLKSKSKTFPQQPNQIAQISTPDQQLEYLDLDAITIVCPSKAHSNGSQATSELISTNLRSKLRSNNSNQKNPSPIKSPISFTNFNSITAPPSPAELLRKYSSSAGYVCEMDKLFKGSSITVTQCLECENLRKCPESFYDRSIPIETTESIDEDESMCWISKCLNNESYLNENSKYMCDQCNSKQEAKIHTQYTQMPNILILHLLSYGITSSDDGNLNTRKLSNRLQLVNCFDFICKKEDSQFTPKKESSDNVFKSPITTRRQLQLKKENQTKETVNNYDLIQRHQFKLFAVVMHSGVSLNSGHYTAFVNYKIINQNKIQENSLGFKSDRATNLEPSTEWLHFDDTKVKSLSNNEFQRKIIDSNYDSPYILFYVRD